jgi:glycosyltransferase involved in cell wall biosynthesis
LGMKIAIYDYLVVPTNPAGSCHRALVAALAGEHDFTVFSTEFDNPKPDRVSWVRVPSVRRPLAALFLTFHIAAIIGRLKWGGSHKRFTIVQSVESNLSFGDIVYGHFCHRWFLKHRWKSCGAKGLRGAARWLDHALHALIEPWTYRHAKWIISPSHGLARELQEEYPFVTSKIRVIPNPVDLDSFRAAPDFDRDGFRSQLGFDGGDRVIAFIALGHFELKGLPLLLETLTKPEMKGCKLVVVGGMPDLVDGYERRVRAMGLAGSVRLVGHQKDVRPYLWAADLFALPSSYEVFPLVALQAAAAGCPILVTKINGVEEFLVDGESCLMVGANAPAVLAGLRRFDGLRQDERRRLGDHAQIAVRAYGVDRFAAAWSEFYRTVARESSGG